MKNKTHSIVFNFKRETEKSIMVQKKTKTINKFFFIPKSIILNQSQYTKKNSLAKDLSYEIERICLELPNWYCKKELGFYK